MNARLLLSLLLSVLLCGCAANTPYTETVVDTEKHTQQRALPDAPRREPLTYQPGLDSGSAMGAFGGQ